ncbi:MAG: terminase family protein [Phycisphaeraceae bacterium]
MATLTSRSVSPSPRLKKLAELAPRQGDQLHWLMHALLGLRVPRMPIVPGHQAPFDYVHHAYFNTTTQNAGSDAVVWAARGSGKTMLGAAVTLMEMLFKPGIRIRILGGSFEQSARMHRYLLHMLERPVFQGLLAGDPTQRRVALCNGSEVQLLAQSQTSVRGTRVHKLRCDEVEEFDPDIWQAAQLVTQSGWCGDTWVTGSVEALSTMHRPHGLMSQLTGNSEAAEGVTRARTVFRWSALDVIERCPSQRACGSCILWRDCQGRAKDAAGFVTVDDLIAQRRRVDDDTWSGEMLCQRPSTSDSVYRRFTRSRHVRPIAAHDSQAYLVAGIDFGLRNPTVVLLAQVAPLDGEAAAHWPVHVVAEYVGRERTLEENLAWIDASGWPRPRWVGIDPAGEARNGQTGRSDAAVLRRRGHAVRACREEIVPGIARVRRRLDHDTLVIDPACTELITAMESYRYDALRPQREAPVKDGADHACDALRYLLRNLECASAAVEGRRW